MMKKQETKHLFKFRHEFKDFWAAYCKTFDLKLSYIMEADRLPAKASNYLRRIKSEALHAMETPQDAENYLIIKKAEKAPLPTSKTLDVIDEAQDEIRKVVKINFTSEITTATVNRIQEAVTFKELLTRDYFYYNNGGTDDYEKLPGNKRRKRFKEQLSHLEITKHVRYEMQRLIDKLVAGIDDISTQELKETNTKLNTLKKVIAGARELDLQALDFLAKMSDDDFATQKALNGAIINDQTMVDNGQLVIEGEQKAEPLSPENLTDDLKAIGQGLFDQQLDIIGDCAEIEEEKQEPIDAELLQDE